MPKLKNSACSATSSAVIAAQAGYNYLFGQEDKSKGVHNMTYTTGRLNTSIAKLAAANK